MGYLFVQIMMLLGMVMMPVDGGTREPVAVNICVFHRDPAINPLTGGIQWLPTPQAIVKVGEAELAFKDSLGCHHGMVALASGMQLTVTAAGFRPFSDAVMVPAGYPLTRQVYLSSLQDFRVYVLGKHYDVADPRLYQKAASEAEPLGENGSFSRVDGCIIGVFSQVADREFLAFMRRHHIAHHYVDSPGGYFSIAPSSGEDAEDFYRRVLPLLRSQDWVRDAGPLLSQESQGILFLTGGIYVEFTGNADAAMKAKVLSHPGVLKTAALPGMVGVVVYFEDGMGLDIVRLAEEFKNQPGIHTADVLTERIEKGDLREHGDEGR
jgi:hypothetical protein